MNPVAAVEIASVDWPTYQEAGGPAIRLGEALRDLLSSSSVEESSRAWNEIVAPDRVELLRSAMPER